ncbi:hypothetical protein D3C80_1513190 [compost metagenome]
MPPVRTTIRNRPLCSPSVTLACRCTVTRIAWTCSPRRWMAARPSMASAWSCSTPMAGSLPRARPGRAAMPSCRCRKRPKCCWPIRANRPVCCDSIARRWTWPNSTLPDRRPTRCSFSCLARVISTVPAKPYCSMPCCEIRTATRSSRSRSALKCGARMSRSAASLSGRPMRPASTSINCNWPLKRRPGAGNWCSTWVTANRSSTSSWWKTSCPSAWPWN